MSRLTKSLSKIREVKTSMSTLSPKWIITDIRFDGLPTAEVRFDVVDLEVSYDKDKDEFQATLDFVGGHEEEAFDSDANKAVKQVIGDFLEYKMIPRIPEEIIDKLYKGEF